MSESSQARNFSLPLSFAIALAVSAGLLVFVGGMLLFFPAFARPRWVWQIAPYNAGFLGAVYLSAVVPLGVVLWVRRWSPARLVLPMLWTFVTQLLVVSFAHAAEFNFNRRATGLWFGLYLADCLVGTYYLGRWGGRPAVGGNHPRMQRSLHLQSIIFAIYGVGLLIWPATFSSFWPWSLDAFHSRLYSAMFVSGAVGSNLLARTATRLELGVFGALQTTLGSGIIAALVMVDGRVGKVDWSAAGTRIWLAGFGGLAIAGAIALRQAARSDRRCQ